MGVQMRAVTRRDHGWERMGIGSAVADNQPKWVLEKGFREHAYTLPI